MKREERRRNRLTRASLATLEACDTSSHRSIHTGTTPWPGVAVSAYAQAVRDNVELGAGPDAWHGEDFDLAY